MGSDSGIGCLAVCLPSAEGSSLELRWSFPVLVLSLRRRGNGIGGRARAVSTDVWYPVGDVVVVVDVVDGVVVVV